MPNRTKLRGFALLGLLTAGPVLADANHPNLAQGLSMPTTYVSGGFDTVNAFNGNLMLRIPMGSRYPVGPSLGLQLVLYYNSNIWNQTDAGSIPFTDDVTTFAEPGIGAGFCAGCDTHNAGAGWRLSLGMLWPPNSEPVNMPVGVEASRYLLIEPDGTRRLFYETLHTGETFSCARWDGSVCEDGLYYTRDGSYLRANIIQEWDGGGPAKDALISATIEHPDGLRRKFNGIGQLTSIEDRHGNAITIAHNAENGSSPPHWVITDNHERTHTVWFNPTNVPNVEYRRQQVDRIELAAFGDQTLILRFHYTDAQVEDAQEPGGPLVAIPLLNRIELDSPTGASNQGEYEFEYYTEVGPPGFTGAIEKATLPTLGEVEWEYGAYILGSGAIPGFIRIVAGVNKKTLRDASDGLIGEWKYEQASTVNGFLGIPGSHPTNESRTRVTTPEGDEIHYFFGIDDTGGVDDWRHGLPFSPAKSITVFADNPPGPGNLAAYLSSEVKDGGTTVRRNYVRYTADPAQFVLEPFACNRRLLNERTYFDDDSAGGNQYVENVRSDWVGEEHTFDGLGHFRKARTTGNFPVSGSRTNLVGYNPTSGHYNYDRELETFTPSPTFQPPSTGLPWIIETFDLQGVSGPTYGTVYTDFCFNTQTGFLNQRRMRAGGGLSTHDIIETYQSTGGGFVTSVRQYGGDDSPTLPTGAGCQAPTGSPVYEHKHTYQHGALKTSAYVDAQGAEVLWYVDHHDDETDPQNPILGIDQNTGLPGLSWDVSQTLSTAFGYDRLSRLTATQPKEGGWTSYFHQKATGPSSLATTTMATCPNQQLACASPLEELLLRYDALGRLDREQETLPSTVRRRDVARNALGWVLESSEWTSHGSPLTQDDLTSDFSEFDAFGRPGSIVPPDGPGHRINLDYEGVRKLDRRVRIATDTGEDCTLSSPAPFEECSTTSEIYDELGRLRSVTERSGITSSGGTSTQITTNYTYDGLGRLRKVTTTDAGLVPAVTQTREFEYDGRDFLIREKHPEQNDWTRYCYDASGNLTRRYQSSQTSCTAAPQPFDLSFDYDRAQRLESTTNGAGQQLQTFTYWGDSLGTANAHGKGRLQTATRNNHLSIGGGTLLVQAQETYRHNGTNGRISERLTNVGGAGYPLTWREGYTYNFLGDVSTLSYPCLANPTTWQCTETGTLALAHSYTKGYLTGIANWLQPDPPGITYHDNGMLDEIRFLNLGSGGNHVYKQTKDPNNMQRPAGIALGAFGSPTFIPNLTYDGAGNVKSFFFDSYRYDPVSRVVSHTAGNLPGDPKPKQEYAYDAFGNLTTITRRNYNSGISGGGCTFNECTTFVPYNPATNRLTSASTYDQAGNLTTSGSATFDYDDLSTLLSAGGEHYVYTADGERIGILNRDGGEDLWRLRDLGGQVLREHRYSPGSGCTDDLIELPPPFTITTTETHSACITLTASTVTIENTADVTFTAGSTVRLSPGFRVKAGATLQARIQPQTTNLLETQNHVYALGYRIATESSTDGRAYIAPNWLGSPGIIIDADNPTNFLDHFHFAFGERLALPGTQWEVTTANQHLNSQYLFTGHERDTLGGTTGSAWMDDLDHMHARSYWGLYGRFVSADPLALDERRRPQGWNRYGYALSNPTTFIDLFGLLGVPFSCKGTRCTERIDVYAFAEGDFAVGDFIDDINRLLDKDYGIDLGDLTLREFTALVREAGLSRPCTDPNCQMLEIVGAAADDPILKAIRAAGLVEMSLLGGGPARFTAVRTISAEGRIGQAFVRSSLAQRTFGSRSILNRGQRFRIGFGRGEDGGRLVFRVSGDFVRNLGFQRGKIDLVDFGRIPRYRP